MSPVYERAWAAGFFDGEGWTSFLQSPRHRDATARGSGSLRMAVAQVERTTLDRFMQAVGNLGKVYGPYKRSRPDWEPRYEWRANGKVANEVIDLLWPFLSEPKKEQAQRARAAYNAYYSYKRRDIAAETVLTMLLHGPIDGREIKTEVARVLGRTPKTVEAAGRRLAATGLIVFVKEGFPPHSLWCLAG